ncbi:MAG: sialate O-acetylesterase [Verrucomicrobiales bacterium]
MKTVRHSRLGFLPAFQTRVLPLATGLLAMFALGVQARTWTSPDGSKTFEGELKSYDPATGMVGVTLANGKELVFKQDKLSADDIAFLQEKGATGTPPPAPAASVSTAKVDVKTDNLFAKSDGKPANMSKPVQVFILLGQSNMVGLGKVGGGDGSLEFAVKSKSKYPYLVGDDGSWVERKDVRFVQYMQGKGQMRNEWMKVEGKNLGPEYGIGHGLGNALDEPVMILKSCIGNRSLGWDLLPPGSEPYDYNGTMQPGYRGTPGNPKGNGEKVEGEWYAGKQWDDDIEAAKLALSDLSGHYPDATKYEVAGFFFWQGEKDCGNPAHAEKYEENLVRFIKALRTEFNSPNAKFVLGTLGESTKGSGGNGGKVLDAHLAVDGESGKHSEFKGNVATVYTNPMAQGGSGNGHYGGKAEVYMDVGEAMATSMVKLLGGK